MLPWQWAVQRRMTVRQTGDGPHLVWIHGLGESSVSFEPVVERMIGYTHVLVDLPGYGRSIWPDRAAGLEEVADGLATWLADKPTSILIGHSMGGVLAQLVAERAPQVAGIVNIDGNISRGDCTFSAAAQAYSLEDFRSHGFAELRAKVYADGATRPELRGYHAAMCFASPDMFHRHACDLVEMSSTNTLAPRLAALKVPALFVAGVPEGVCVETRRQLEAQGIRWVGIEPAGHWVYLDQLERFVEVVHAFCAEANK